MRKATLLLVFLFSLTWAFSQEKTITGKVKDETGNGMPGATVQLKGTTKGTLTDINGDFTLKVPSTGGTLVFSYVGYLSQEIEIGEQTTFEVQLSPDVQKLDEVVVIGYGVQKKSLVTGSISKIDSKDITAVPATRIDQALQGKTSGVYIAQSSGAPGGSMSIKIRGNASDGKNDPIYIVNGVKTGNIDFLAPGDIESIEILKDAASAAIYGAEGGNGVVIITTKKAVKGVSQVNYNYYHGWQSAAHTIQPMTAQQYIDYMKEAYQTEFDNGVIKKTAYDAAMLKYNKMEADGYYTNWMSEIFGNAPMDEHNISFNTGSDKSSMLLSASYLDQDGIVGGDKANYTRYTFTFNGTSQVKSWLSVESNVTYTRSKKHNLNENSDFGNGIISGALYFDPTIPIYYNDTSELPTGWKPGDGPVYDALIKTSDGKIFRNSLETVGDVSNPLAQIYMTNNTTTTDKLLGNIKSDISLPFNIKFTTLLGLDYSLVFDNVFNPKYYFDAVNSQVKDSSTSVSNTYTKYFKYNFDNYFTFSRNIAEFINIDGVIGMSYENYQPTFLYAQGYQIPNNDLSLAYIYNRKNNDNYDIDGGIGTRYSHDLSEKQCSYFGRLAINFSEILLLQGNFRRDGSSLFGPNHKFGNFPSLSAGINLHKLDFIKDNFQIVNNLKVRGSWGKNGNKQVLNPFAYTSVMVTKNAYVDGSGKLFIGSLPAKPANPDLVWETSEQLDFGLDLGLLNNRITFSIDYFNKKTKDQLGENAKVPYYLGFSSSPMVNNGEVLNKGWEFDLAYREMEKEFKYTISLNASYLYNEVTSYGANFKTGYRMNIGDYVTRYEPGHPVWFFYGLKSLGVFQDTAEINHYVNADGKLIQPKAIPGDLKYADIDGDGKIGDGDLTMIGKPLPDWTFGLNFSCNYKFIDFGLFLQGATGNQVFFAAIQQSRPMYNKPDFYYTERWTGPGTSNTFPRATYKDNNNNFRSSSLNVHDADYLRLKNITLGFTIPSQITNKIGISKFRVYVSANNLLVLTKYKGTDPEVGQLFDSQNNNSYGVDRGLYPMARLITTGVNITF